MIQQKINELLSIKKTIENMIDREKILDAFIGIDPGKEGGVFGIIYDKISNEYIYKLDPIPKIGEIINLKELNEIISQYSLYNSTIVLEDVHAIFGSSAKATFNFGWNLGVLEGIIVSNKIPYLKISPKIWQAKLFKGIKEQKDSKGKVQTKLMAFNAVQNLLPNVNFLITSRMKKPHEGLVDAACLALYCLKNEKEPF